MCLCSFISAIKEPVVHEGLIKLGSTLQGSALLVQKRIQHRLIREFRRERKYCLDLIGACSEGHAKAYAARCGRKFRVPFLL